MNSLIKTLFQRVLPFAARVGFDPADSDDARLQKTMLLLGSFTFIGAGILWGLLYFSLGEYIAGSIPLGYVIISSFSVAIFHLTRGYKFLLFSQLLLILILPFLLMIALGGFIKSSAVIIWSLLSPLGALLFGLPGQALRWLAAYLSLAVISAYFEFHPLVTSSLSPAVITVFFVMNLGTVSAIAIFLLVYFVNQKNMFFELLLQEQVKSENLLLNILPRNIAARLKQGEETIADDYDSVSILFVDLVDFTALSTLCDPRAMVKALGEMFSYFDQLVEKYEAQKIETVGDSYVIAAGLPNPRPDHATVITHLALEIREHFERGVFLEGHPLHCRMGINSGSIMAGVIERKKISYNVWGDTVNTASRMQSHGIPGQVQVSEATYEQIKADFICGPRGAINVKGKGDMNVWLVVSERDEQVI